MLPKHHFKLVSHRQTSFSASDTILNFFTRMALPTVIQFLCAEFFQKVYDEAVKRGCVGHFDEGNETKLIAMMSELGFIPNTPAPATVKPASKTNRKTPANV
jgi:hypothetical protein